MPREIIIHLNAELPDTDERDANEVADQVVAALSAAGISVTSPLAEEI